MYQSKQNSDDADAGDALDLALDLIVQSGLKGLSLRSLAQKLGISPSLLNYRYGSRDALAERAFAYACDRSAELWGQRASALMMEGISAADLPAIIHATVIDTAITGRREAMIAWICQTKAMRFGLYKDTAIRWHEDCTDFWQKMLAHTGLPPELAPGMCAMLSNICHIGLIAAPMPAVSAWLHDIVQRLTDRLMRREPLRPGDSPWRSRIERDTLAGLAQPPADSASTPDRIIAAAARIIAESGPDALTHRAIAKRADVSLSSMTHHFASLQDILLKSYETIYTRLRDETIEAARPAGKLSIETLLDSLSPDPRTAPKGRDQEVMAMDEIILAAARRPETQPIAAGLLAMVGQTSSRLMESLEGKRVRIDRLDGQIMRFLLVGLQEQVTLGGEDRDTQWFRSQFTLIAKHFYY